ATAGYDRYPAAKLFMYNYLRLRKRAGEENRAGVPSPSLANQEDHILPSLELASDAPEVVLAIYWLLVDLKDHVAAAQTDVFGKGSRFHVADDYAFICRNSQAISHVWRDCTDGN